LNRIIFPILLIIYWRLERPVEAVFGDLCRRHTGCVRRLPPAPQL